MVRVILLGVTLLLTWHSKAEEKKEETKGNFPVVVVSKITPTPLADKLLYPAKVAAKSNVAVLSPVEGYVQKVNVRLGSQISKGQAILSIRNSDPTYEYVPYQVEAVTDGVISFLPVSVGAKVLKGQELAMVIDPKSLMAEVEVPARDINRIFVGLKGDLSFGNHINQAEQSYKVKVTAMSPVIDANTGTAPIELQIENVNDQLKAGYIGRVTFPVNQRNGIEIQEDAIVYQGKDTLVRLVVDNNAKFVPVKIAQSKNGKAEIESGLKDGDVIIVRANMYVNDGQEVAIQDGSVATK